MEVIDKGTVGYFCREVIDRNETLSNLLAQSSDRAREHVESRESEEQKG